MAKNTGGDYYWEKGQPNVKGKGSGYSELSKSYELNWGCKDLHFPYTKWSEQRVEQQGLGWFAPTSLTFWNFSKICWVWIVLYLQNFRLQKFSSLCSWHPQRLPFAAWKIKIYLEPQVQVVLSGAREKWGKLRFFCHIHNAKCDQNYNLGCADCSVTSLTVLQGWAFSHH